MFGIRDNEFVVNIFIASLASVLNTLFTGVLSAALSAIFGLS